MLEMAVEYVKLRQQFGQPVGAFQAVQHPLANAKVALELARPLVYRAAYSTARDDSEGDLHVAMPDRRPATRRCRRRGGAAGARRDRLQFRARPAFVDEARLALAAGRAQATERVAALVLDGDDHA